MQLHVHIFALGVIVLILSLLLAAADIGRLWQVLLPIVGFLGLWMDAAGWVLGSVGEWAVWLIMGGGGLLAAAIGLMSLLVLLDCWLRVPLLGRIPDPED
jgi:hypothetical protein